MTKFSAPLRRWFFIWVACASATGFAGREPDNITKGFGIGFHGLRGPIVDPPAPPKLTSLNMALDHRTREATAKDIEPTRSWVLLFEDQPERASEIAYRAYNELRIIGFQKLEPLVKRAVVLHILVTLLKDNILATTHSLNAEQLIRMARRLDASRLGLNAIDTYNIVYYIEGSFPGGVGDAIAAAMAIIPSPFDALAEVDEFKDEGSDAPRCGLFPGEPDPYF